MIGNRDPVGVAADVVHHLLGPGEGCLGVDDPFHIAHGTPSTSYTYDNNGSTVTKVDSTGTTTYTWDYVNQLSSVALPASGGTVSFRYDPFGRRIQKASTSGTTTNYLYDGRELLEEVDNSGNVLARYTQSTVIDEPLAMLRSGTTSYYQSDALGSSTSLTNSGGALARTYIYDSFGDLTASTGALSNPFQFTGREFDSEMGTYYYRARYYDQNTGRFISGDPIQFKGGINFYAYVHNDPADLVDPLGLCDDKNCRLNISCGPTSRTHGFSHCTVTIQNGSSYTAYDGGPSGSIWWSQLKVNQGPGAPPGSDSIFNAPVPCDCAQREANSINSGSFFYSFPIQNSNTAAWMLAAACGVRPTLPW